MAQIRSSIELLCSILHNNGCDKMKAEVFRLAKFNNDEATPQFWRLIYELLYFCKFGSIDDVSIEAFSKLSKAEICSFVKNEMRYCGFYSRDFDKLPNDMSRGSRELLLALGWLVCREKIIERFMHQCSTPIDNTENGRKNGMIQVKKPMSPLRAEELSDENMTNRVQQLLWLNGKLRMSLRNLYLIQREQALSADKTSEASAKEALAPLEEYLLRHPELLKRNLQLLEADNERLQQLLDWGEHEEIFWQWMESVLDNKLADVAELVRESANASPGSDSEATSQTAVESRSSSVIEREADVRSARNLVSLETLHATLHDTVVKYDSIVHHLERICKAESNTVTDDEIDELSQAVSHQLSFHSENAAQVMLSAVTNICNTTKSEGDRGLVARLNELQSLTTSSAAASTGKVAAFAAAAAGDATSNLSTAGSDDSAAHELATAIDGMNRLSARMEKQLADRQVEYERKLEQILARTSSRAVLVPNSGPSTSSSRRK